MGRQTFLNPFPPKCDLMMRRKTIHLLSLPGGQGCKLHHLPPSRNPVLPQLQKEIFSL